MKIKRIESNIEIVPLNKFLIEKYKSPNNLLRHTRFIPNKTKGVMIIDKVTNNLVGYIAWELDFIIALEVIKEYRGNGWSKVLLDIAINNGATKLSVRKDNKVAIKLYEGMGFNTYLDSGKMLFMKL